MIAQPPKSNRWQYSRRYKSVGLLNKRRWNN